MSLSTKLRAKYFPQDPAEMRLKREILVRRYEESVAANAVRDEVSQTDGCAKPKELDRIAHPVLPPINV